MLDPSVFKPFEEEGDALIRHFALEQYASRVFHLSKERLHCDGGIDVTRTGATLAPFRKFMKDFRGDSAYISIVAAAYVSTYRDARNNFSPYHQDFGPEAAPTDPVGNLLPVSALRPRKDPPSVWDMRRLVEMTRWLMRAHRPRLERTAALEMLRRTNSFSIDYFDVKTTRFLENLLYEGNIPLWMHLLLGSEYCHVEKALSLARFSCSPDGRLLYLEHGRPGPMHWERSYSYGGLAELAERIATWDAGWALGRVVELVESEVYRIEGAHDGAEERRSVVETVRCPWLFDEKGDYKPMPQRCDINALRSSCSRAAD